jgi:hypothetical protein
VSLRRGCFFVQIAPEPASHPDIVLSQNGGWHVSLAKTKSTGSPIQRLPFRMGNSVHDSDRNAFDAVPAPAHLILVNEDNERRCSSWVLSLGNFL